MAVVPAVDEMGIRKQRSSSSQYAAIRSTSSACRVGECNPSGPRRVLNRRRSRRPGQGRDAPICTAPPKGDQRSSNTMSTRPCSAAGVRPADSETSRLKDDRLLRDRAFAIAVHHHEQYVRTCPGRNRARRPRRPTRPSPPPAPPQDPACCPPRISSNALSASSTACSPVTESSRSARARRTWRSSSGFWRSGEARPAGGSWPRRAAGRRYWTRPAAGPGDCRGSAWPRRRWPG